MSLSDDVIDKVSGCARKSRYSDESRAKLVARKCWYDRGVDLRPYACESCGGWHLTKSQAPPQMKAGWRLPAPSKEERAKKKRDAKRARRRR